ncbi:MAG: T9SS type A sorting domain-containing protein [Bacteroidota bacterium]
MKILNLFLTLVLVSLSTLLSAQFYTNGSNRLYTYDFLGIDVSSPNYDLEVKSNIASVNDNGYLRTLINAPGDGATGIMTTYGYGRRNVRISALSSNAGNGYVAVYDNAETNQAGIYVNSSGRGVIYGDIKNFRMDHPTKTDQEIWYASLEGPEAAAYERGQATLVNGEIFVEFSEHFQLVINANDMTVMTTPNDADTYGLAVVEKTTRGFKVKELKNGTGNFSFDWEVKAVRKGYEDFQVIREKNAERPIEGSSDKEEEDKGGNGKSLGINQTKSPASLTNLRLSQNYPNPSAKFTSIPVFVANDIQNAVLNIYSASGKLMESIGVLDRGESEIGVSLMNYASGNYYYSLEADGVITKTRTLTVGEQ